MKIFFDILYHLIMYLLSIISELVEMFHGNADTVYDRSLSHADPDYAISVSSRGFSGLWSEFHLYLLGVRKCYRSRQEIITNSQRQKAEANIVFYKR